MAPNRRHAIILANADTILSRIYAELGVDELTGQELYPGFSLRDVIDII